MTRNPRFPLVVMMVALFAGHPGALARAQTLTFDAVARSIERHHPRMLREEARVEVAEGEFTAARGAFDPSVTIRGTSYLTGYYDNDRLDFQVDAPTPFYGLALTGGYRYTRGVLPVYDGRAETLGRGELRLGLRMPLLRDLSIDTARANRTRAELDVGVTGHQLAATRLELLRLGAIAYYRWVATGLALAVSERMLALAEVRNAQLERMSGVGSIAPIEARENLRAVLQRRARRVVAEQRLAEAAVQLSLYMRDRDGRPRVPRREELPPEPSADLSPVPELEALIEEALAIRPELAALRQQLDRASVAIELARNGRLPRLDAQIGVSRDLGTGTDDQQRRLEETVLEAGVVLTSPIPNRTATGRASAREADLGALEAELVFSVESLSAQVAEARVAVLGATAALELERSAFEVAAELARAEWRRFEEGSTTLLLVNLREQTAAEAELAYFERLVELALARVRLSLAIGRVPGG